MAFDGAPATAAVDFLDIEFSGVDLEMALDRIAVRASLNLPFAYVATPNVDHVVSLARDAGRRPLYDAAWLTLNDSCVLRSLAARAGLDLPVATGADLAERLLERVIDRHEPITVIGGDTKSIAELKRRYGLTDVRWHCPPMGLKNNPDAIVAAADFAALQGARFTFICVGAPQQELIAYAMRRRGDATGVGLCVGAALDFLSGRANRAPQWMRDLGVEWLHRLVSQPRRMWRRYLVDGPAVFSLFSAWRASMAA
ncbi:WecB/TagA/CpsF family glycosyltransferase [Terricaulis sp.]|uniref:WecB/TagA/CpsF family glycosyltransferase n=1 Tax=Terricaulis sp. TaxID=2768686 RepID=UPI0037843C5A